MFMILPKDTASLDKTMKMNLFPTSCAEIIYLIAPSKSYEESPPFDDPFTVESPPIATTNGFFVTQVP